MLWYLPDRYPIFWEEMRRRCFGRRRTGLIIGLMLLALVPVGITLLVILWPPASTLLQTHNGFLHDYVWRALLSIQLIFLLAPPVRLLSIVGQLAGQLPIQHLFLMDSSFAFLILQHMLFFLLAPSIAASVISSEREQGTLEMHLFTPVTPSALVWQKFLNLFALLATIPFFFVILITIFCSFNIFQTLEFIRSYFYLLITLSSYISISLYFSSICKTTRFAIAFSYVSIIVMQLIITLILSVILFELCYSRQNGIIVDSDTMYRLSFGKVGVGVYVLITYCCLLMTRRKITALYFLTHHKQIK